MAGKIIADTLEHSTAGSLDTQYVVNGSAKAWADVNASATYSIRNSLNISSVSDLGTGLLADNFASTMSAADYSAFCLSQLNGDFGQRFATDPTASAWTYEIKDSGQANIDRAWVHSGILGDLA
jgi:hypothetical protein